MSDIVAGAPTSGRGGPRYLLVACYAVGGLVSAVVLALLVLIAVDGHPLPLLAAAVGAVLPFPLRGIAYLLGVPRPVQGVKEITEEPITPVKSGAMKRQELTYTRGWLSTDELDQEIERFWSELKTNPELQAEVAAVGLDSDVVRTLEPSDAIQVRVGSSGVDTTSVSLIITFAPTANRVLEAVWTTILLPRIRRRWGTDAVGHEIYGSSQ